MDVLHDDGKDFYHELQEVLVEPYDKARVLPEHHYLIASEDGISKTPSTKTQRGTPGSIPCQDRKKTKMNEMPYVDEVEDDGVVPRRPELDAGDENDDGTQHGLVFEHGSEDVPKEKQSTAKQNTQGKGDEQEYSTPDGSSSDNDEPARKSKSHRNFSKKKGQPCGKVLSPQEVTDLVDKSSEEGAAALPLPGALSKKSIKAVCDTLVINCPKSHTVEEMEANLREGVEAGSKVADLFGPSPIIKPPCLKPVLGDALLALKNLPKPEKNQGKKTQKKPCLPSPKAADSPARASSSRPPVFQPPVHPTERMVGHARSHTEISSGTSEPGTEPGSPWTISQSDSM